ncbi:lipopolysaccharide biosynthesis protein [Arthrobacter sp. D2-10]
MTARLTLRRVLFPAPVLAPAPGGLGAAFGLTVTGIFVQGLTRLGYSVLVGRVLGPAALGDLASVLALASFLVLFWPAAGANAAGKFIALARGEEDLQTARATERFVASSSTIAGCILSTVAALVVVFQFGAGWLAGIMAGALTVALSGYSFSRGLRVGYGHFVTTAVWDILASALSLTLLMGVLVAGWEAVLLLPLVAGYTLFAVTAWPANASGKLSPERKREILRFSAWSSLNIMAAGGLLQLSIVLARSWSSGVELGLYSAAVQLATPASMLSSAMLTAMGPSLVTKFAAGDLLGMRQELGRIMNITIAFFMPLFVFGVIWAEVAMLIVFGFQFTQGATYLGTLLVAVSVTSFNAANARLNGTEERGIRELAAVNFTALVAGVAVMLWLGPLLGASGSAVGYLTGALISGTVPFLIVWRRDSMAWLPVLARLTVAYLAMVVALVGQHSTGGAIWWNIACSGVFVVIWSLLNATAFTSGMRRGRSVLRRPR